MTLDTEAVRTRVNSGASPTSPDRNREIRKGGVERPDPAEPTCPTCGCPVHPQPKTWEVVCTSCGEKRWPLTVIEPASYVCGRCRVTSPEKRAAARAAGQKSAESRRKRAAR
jgi:DNA-directed RNA polymerase subunit RPC12/RpoP